jgi:hypothetical protein
LKENGKTVVRFAENLNYNYRSALKILKKTNIDAVLLLRISILPELDFFRYYSRKLEKYLKKEQKYAHTGHTFYLEERFFRDSFAVK